MKFSFTYVLIGVVVLCIGLIVVARYYTVDSGPGKLDGFAQCLTDKGAKFYGAFWCPHCQAQKSQFGKSMNLLPYVECSLPNGTDRTAICTEKKIESFPTWDFADGSRLQGVQSLAALAEKTQCVLPE